MYSGRERKRSLVERLREKRKRKLVIRGVKLERNERKQEAEGSSKDIGEGVEMKKIKGVEVVRDGKPKVWVVELESEEQEK